MFRSSEEAAVAASIALLLEVSGNPKAGNVDREHDFEDLKYEHFLISAAAALPAFIEAAKDKKIAIFKAVENGLRFGLKTNVHFGAFLLLFPLLAAWDAEDAKKACKRATEFLKKTKPENAIEILKAYKLCKPRVLAASKASLEDEETEKFILEKKLNVFDWMNLAQQENLISKELVNCYPISLEGAKMLLNGSSIVELYHSLLSRYPDPLIIAKKSKSVAFEVMKMAKEAFLKKSFEELDETLLKIGANPGTIADLTASSIYLAIVESWRL